MNQWSNNHHVCWFGLLDWNSMGKLDSRIWRPYAPEKKTKQTKNQWIQWPQKRKRCSDTHNPMWQVVIHNHSSILRKRDVFFNQNAERVSECKDTNLLHSLIHPKVPQKAKPPVLPHRAPSSNAPSATWFSWTFQNVNCQSNMSQGRNDQEKKKYRTLNPRDPGSPSDNASWNLTTMRLGGDCTPYPLTRWSDP